MSVAVEGVEAGRKSEPWAVKTLCAKLKQLGLAVSRVAGEDHRGEDALLKVGESTYVVQLITTPSAKGFWRDAHAASAMRQGTIEQAVEWLREAIEAKVQMIPPAQRVATILAIDARHAGLLAQEPVTDVYVGRFGPRPVRTGLHPFGSSDPQSSTACDSVTAFPRPHCASGHGSRTVFAMMKAFSALLLAFAVLDGCASSPVPPNVHRQGATLMQLGACGEH
jgi:hypothetical protein